MSHSHGVLGSTFSGSLVTTPLTHGVASTHGVSLTHGVALAHEVALKTTHTGTLTLGTHGTSRAPGVSTPPKLRVHPSAALLPLTSRGTTEPTWS